MAEPPTRTLTAVIVAAGLLVASAPIVAAGHEYKQPVWFNWETTELDIQVVGVDDPVVVREIENAITAWRTGIEDLDPDGLGSELVLRDYVPGSDVAPPAGFEAHDVEIVVAPQGGFALNTGLVTDLALGEGTCTAHAPLSHESLYTDNGQYRAALHEIGHCLGLDHVFEHGEEYEPAVDPMGGGRDARACPSNLNLQVMDRAFDDRDGWVTVASSDYVQADCVN